jgi:thioredoxin
MVGPVLEEIAREQGGRVKVVKVNVDDNPGLASDYGVMSIPTMIIFKQGKLVERFVGAMPKAAIDKRLSQWL